MPASMVEVCTHRASAWARADVPLGLLFRLRSWCSCLPLGASVGPVKDTGMELGVGLVAVVGTGAAVAKTVGEGGGVGGRLHGPDPSLPLVSRGFRLSSVPAQFSDSGGRLGLHPQVEKKVSWA